MNNVFIIFLTFSTETEKSKKSEAGSPPPGIVLPKMTTETFESLVRLSKVILYHTEHMDIYLDAVNEHLNKFVPEERLKTFGKFIRHILFHLRSDPFVLQEFNVQQLAHDLVLLSSISGDLKMKEIEIILEDAIKDRRGAMKFVLEEDFEEALSEEFKRSAA